ncbi:hypothetical protein RO3G_02825 [Rhizopus delemar RA 99-880]|uniref:Uncharacterized protein n=1 Tax=Rhizopus delemar (strain RA 99-880 / ATCC MYA-4621 / FGSC 9543 / NRRL 43880) TaxID=246409 RepID=I1BPJ1_RHIO9|nr:hypothetical protein RO3G_02825 [Rhizopus delemar RA 99-880]|eukprot:EIE78121.1 hypothetical protein RO3G_02825 [Rhizopus delemar RA 99-880]
MLKLNVGPVEIVVLHTITKRSVQNMLLHAGLQNPGHDVEKGHLAFSDSDYHHQTPNTLILVSLK